MTIQSASPATPKVTVIANCHTGPLAQLLAFAGRGFAVDGIFIDTWHNPDSDCRQKANALVAETGPDDIIFTFNLSRDFGNLETNHLRSVLGPQLTTFTNIRFDGLHPDLSYFGPFGGRWPNILSEYHSKIVVHSFAAGRSVADCLAAFNGKTYERLGYYSVFDSSAAELRRRDATCDVQFAEAFLALIKEHYCLLTVNHPTSIVFDRLARMLCAHRSLSFLHFEPTLYPNPLVQTIIWPILNEVAEYHRLSYRTPQFFVGPPMGYVTSNPRSVSLPEFVAASYEFYATRLPKDQFIETATQADTDGLFRNVLA